MIEEYVKKCSRCNEWKEKSRFGDRKDSEDGLMGRCKDCVKKQRKEYRENNKEKIAKQNKIYYETNKKKISKRSKKYYQKNKEKIKKNIKEYQEGNKEKIVKRSKTYRENNKNKIAEKDKIYRENNKEKIAERNKIYRENNKEKIAKYNRNYQKNNKVGVARRNRKYRRNNKEKIAKSNREYRRKNPEKILNWYNTRRQRLNKNKDEITKKDWLKIMKSTNWKCFYCDIILNNKNRTLDHILSLSKKGSHTKENLIPCCRSCNSSKNNKTGEEWKGIRNLSPEKKTYILRIIDTELKKSI